MSVQSDSSQTPTSAGSEVTAETGHAAEAPAAELHLPSDTIGLELVRLLADSHTADFTADVPVGIADAIADAPVADMPVYDGHVALALDMDVLPDIDATLDMLTSSHQLFDVPALDVANVVDDSLPS